MKAGARTEAIPVSARTGAGFSELLQAIDNALPLDPVSRHRFRIPAGEGSLIHLLHERAKVLSSRYRGEILRSGGGGPGIGETAAFRLPCRMIFLSSGILLEKDAALT